MSTRHGIRCPYCQENLFSFHRKTFVGERNDYLRYRAEPPLMIIKEGLNGPILLAGEEEEKQ